MRLIDADGLMEHVWRDKLDSRELIAKMVENAPTVKEIPTKIPMHIFERLLTLTESKNDRCCDNCAFLSREDMAAEIELVIKIPEESYKATCDGSMLPPDVENVVQGIKNGRRLIDVDAILKSVELKGFLEQDGMHLVTIDRVKEALNDALTIVEAESGKGDKDDSN